MIDNFIKAMKYILKIEGGYVNHKNDTGGATNFGITIGTLAEYRKKQVTKEDVKKLDISEAKEIYRLNYWQKLRLSEINKYEIAVIMFDQAVHSGIKQSAMMIQYVISQTTDTRLKVDGIIGPKTLDAINKKDNKELQLHLIRYIQNRYIRICEKNPSQYIFLKGWINRSHNLLLEISA